MKTSSPPFVAPDLSRDFDLERAIAALPPGATVKGLFVDTIVLRAGGRGAQRAARLGNAVIDITWR